MVQPQLVRMRTPFFKISGATSVTVVEQYREVHYSFWVSVLDPFILCTIPRYRIPREWILVAAWHIYIAKFPTPLS